MKDNEASESIIFYLSSFIYSEGFIFSETVRSLDYHNGDSLNYRQFYGIDTVGFDLVVQRRYFYAKQKGGAALIPVRF